MILLSEYINDVFSCTHEWKEEKKKLRIFTWWKPDPNLRKHHVQIVEIQAMSFSNTISKDSFSS